MRERRLPKLGLLGLITDGYEPNFPGITARQEAFAREVIAELSDVAEIYFPGAALNRADIEAKVKEMNEMELDGMIITMLAYSQGSWVVRALQNNRLPLGFAVVQPNSHVEDDFDEFMLTINQGVHGAQDNACAITRMGLKCQFFAGDRYGPELKAWVQDFGKAAQTYTFLKKMKVGIIGKMPGMNDILSDEMAVYSKIGPEYRYDSIGAVVKYMEETTKEEIDARIKLDHEIFDIDPKLSYESHYEAIKMYFGFKKYMDANGLDAFTAHFDIFAEDGRFKQLPLLAASHLMADGYGYAAEGDSMCAAMVAAAHCLGDDDANFTEMYAMDFKRGSIIFCHAGEGNWATHRKDVKPQIIDRFLAEGGLENPPTPRFTPEVGRATLTSLASVRGDQFRLIVAMGDMQPDNNMPNNEMPYFFWKPDCGPAQCVQKWLKNGGTHHEVINLGDISRRWEMLADMLDIECVRI
ncbi:MAG: L-fucose/L-arabinose isomerase family protein [Oscillospiraceae bacterium]|nr:L-fucose/L-arabinose isomerase family protein [Oscillospiraceae bacterium]